MKRIEFAGKHIHKMGIKLEKITYASTVYKIPVEVPDENPAEKENGLWLERSEQGLILRDSPEHNNILIG